MRFSRVLMVVLAVAIVLAAAVWWFVAEDLGRVRGVIRAASATETPELALAALVAAEDQTSFAPQLVKSRIQGRGLRRQFRWLLVTAIVEATESPSAILRACAANVYLGSNDAGLIFGINRGAQIYFGKPAGSLNAAECAALAAAVRSPHMFPVLGDSQRAVARRQIVLRRMEAAGVR